MHKYLKDNIREYIFIILTALIFYTILFSKSFSNDDVFIIENVIVNEKVNLKFSRNNYIDKAFIKSFNILKSKILLNKDLNKVNNVSLKKIKKLIIKFQISEERYKKK